MGSRETQQALENLTVAWQDAGLNPAAIEPVEKVLGRYNAIERERAALADEAAITGEIAERVAAGEVTLAQAVVELHNAEAANERGQGSVLKGSSRGERLYDAAQAAVVRIATVRLNEQASELVRVADAEADPLMAELQKLAGVLEDIPASALELTAAWTDAERAARSDWELLQAAVDAAGRKEATAFAKLGELDKRRGALIRVGDALEAVGISRPSGLVDRSTYELAGVLPVRVAV